MKVSELIKELQEMDQDETVWVATPDINPTPVDDWELDINGFVLHGKGR